MAEKDSYPLPKIEECLDVLSDSTLFCTLDLQTGNWKIEMHPEDHRKTTFATYEGLFEYLCTVFDLCNAPSTFTLFPHFDCPAGTAMEESSDLPG